MGTWLRTLKGYGLRAVEADPPAQHPGAEAGENQGDNHREVWEGSPAAEFQVDAWFRV